MMDSHRAIQAQMGPYIVLQMPEPLTGLEAQPVDFALQFRADNFDAPRPKPAAFCVVLDRSGSMRGKPLEHAKEAASLAIKNMRRDDSFALVLFESSAQVLIPLQPCHEKRRRLRRSRC
jgi:secreted protein with Ig-like and vWFA domain